MTDTRTMSELLGVVSEGTLHLARQEIRLAKSEAVTSLRDFRQQVARVAPRLLGALVIAIAGAVAAAFGLIDVLSVFVLDGRTWLAAFIVAALLGIIAMLAVRSGMHAVSRIDLLPQTTDSIRETASWTTHPTSSEPARDSAFTPTRRPISSAISR